MRLPSRRRTAVPVSLIIPWRPVEGRPARARDFIVGHLLDTLGPVEVVVADDPHPGPFNRGRALHAGVTASSGDVLVFADADLWVPPGALRQALDVVRLHNGYGYAVPFNRVAFLTEEATALVLEGRNSAGFIAVVPEAVELMFSRHSTGGCNVVRRAYYEEAGGFDPRFAGWGYEDAAFDMAVTTLVGPPAHVDALAVHLWHPPAPDRGTDVTDEGLALCRRYEAAAGDEVAMAALLGER